jgi:hypothetical protein
MSSAIDHPVGPMGWGDPKLSIGANIDVEKRMLEAYFNDYPRGYTRRVQASPIPAALLEDWNKFQDSQNRLAGSIDLTLMTQWVFGKKAWFRPQGIGSCVWSNTKRRVVDRMAFQIALRGDAGEYLGSSEFGPTSFAPSAMSYGFARKRANMRGLGQNSDGLYRSPMTESMLKDGFVDCSTPAYVELMKSLGCSSEDSYPEPYGHDNVYRRIGNWDFNDKMLPYADYRLLEAPPVTNVDDLIAAFREFKPGFQCSGIAIKTAGMHKDGFMTHTRNRNDSWGHNMGYGGLRVGSDGKQYIIITNESWVFPNEPDPWKYNYNVPVEEVASWFKNGMLDSGIIGEMDLPKSKPPM